MKLDEIKDPKLRERIIEADAAQNRRLASGAVSKHSASNESVEQDAGKATNAVRSFARITIRSFRTRSLDDDNPFPKYFVDALRYSGAIFDDSKAWAKIEVEQVIVDCPELECTTIEVHYGPS